MRIPESPSYEEFRKAEKVLEKFVCAGQLLVHIGFTKDCSPVEKMSMDGEKRLHFYIKTKEEK